MEKYSDEFLEQLRSEVSLEMVLSEHHVYFKHEAHSAWFAAKCIKPDHQEKTPSMKWKEGDHTLKCFGCGFSGDVFSATEILLKCDFPAAVEAVRKLSPVRGERAEKRKEEVKSAFRSQDTAKKQEIPLAWWDGNPKSRPALDSIPAQEYLSGRGLTPATIKRFRIRFFADGQYIGCEAEHKKCSWVGIPYVVGDRVVSIKYRCTTQGHRGFSSSLGDSMFNMEPASSEFEDVYLTSGEFDAMVLEQAGFRATSMQSDSRPPNVDERTWLLHAGRIIYAGDSDKSGQLAMNKLGMEMEAGKLLTWPDAKDANEFFLKCGSVERFAQRVIELSAAANLVPPHPPGFTPMTSEIDGLVQQDSMAEDPERFVMPWPSVHRMFYILPGHVITVSSALTGTGKSTLVLQAMVHNALVGMPGGPRRKSPAIYAAEQSPDELARMTVAQLLNVSKSSKFTQEQISLAKQALAGARFFIGYDPSKMKAKEVLDLCAGACTYLGITDLVIDNMGFVGRNERPGQLFQAQSDAMQSIKTLAKKTGIRCWVLVAARAAAGHGDRGKWIAQDDVGGTAAFESDADHVISLHRKLVAGREMDENAMDILDPVTTLVRKKSRWPGPGPASTKLLLRGEFARFEELAYDGYSNRTGRDRAAGPE